MAASSAVTNTGLTGLRRNVLNKWVEYLSCTVSKVGLKNPHRQEFWAQGGMSPTLSRGYTLQSTSTLRSLSLSRVSTPTTLLLILNLPGGLTRSYSTHCDLISRAKEQD